MTTPTPAQLAEAAERATPEDDSLDFRRLTRAAQESGRAVLDLGALANSEAVQAIIDLRLAQERVRMLEDCRRRLRWVSVVSSVAGFSLAAGLASLFLL